MAEIEPIAIVNVMPRKRHVSRNLSVVAADAGASVMPRKRHVSRNLIQRLTAELHLRHASQEACE